MPTEPSARLRVAATALILLTVTLRLIVINIDGDRLNSDPDAYVRLATSLSDHLAYSSTDDLKPTAFRPILYPVLLAGPMAAGLSAPTAAAVINLLAGALLVLVVMKLAHACGLADGACTVAGGIVAADPLLVRYTTEPMTENVCAVLVTAAMLWLVRYLNVPQQADNSSAATRGVVAGCLLGLSALCRPVAMVTCVIVTLVLLGVSWRRSRHGGGAVVSVPRRFAWAFLPAVVAAVVVSPWVLRNAIQFHAFIPATTHGGYTLLLANNSEFYDLVVSGKQAAWDGLSLTGWQQELHQQMLADGIDRANEKAVDGWMYGRAIAEIQTQPAAALKGVLLRWRRFWAVTPTAEDSSVPALLRYAVGAWYLLLGIGLAGSLTRVRNDYRILLLWSGILSFLTVHSLFWTNTRMRAPLTGVLIVLAVIGWTMLVGWRQSRDAEPSVNST